MIKIIKNGVVVSVILDTRTINKEGTYPVKIKVYYQGKPKYYSVGLCLTSKEELEEALEGKSKECREIQEEIGKELSRILKNVEYLAERGTFSFDRLNTRLGKISVELSMKCLKLRLRNWVKITNLAPKPFIKAHSR
ncbi:MAG: Arm DNA-binding domain-containing protein [Phocaeicola massiliensis]